MSWNWRNRKARLLLGVALVACVFALAHPLLAHAGYPLARQGGVALGFGARYTSADATASTTHHGTDITAEAGARVLAPFAGMVTFSGRVPGVGGATVRAVTISTSSGTVTLLPLESSAVAKGDSLAEGDVVGTLASNGDGSSAGTHLHVGIKRGDLYVDPMSLLSLP
ncbi:MAG: M23 family metallopeptidase, partial [Coriobacteriia bacterium]|nr:M23 family metallopeptidase [Coriobacteriia bacterium]